MMILRPLKKVYKLPDASLHMFWNERGPVIAFNAGGALFVNLRYFEGWREFSFPLLFIRGRIGGSRRDIDGWMVL